MQQGRLKDKDKLSAEELLDAIRFGADKIFKSKDSSITDDDVSMSCPLYFYAFPSAGCIFTLQSVYADRPDP